MTAIVINLTYAEIWQASVAGCARRVTSVKEGYDKNKHAQKSDWATDIDGALAEMAFAKASNRSFKEPDVGEWHVRSTRHSEGHLIIRPNDNEPEARFVFAITGDRWVSLGWWVPQSALTELQA
jgi:hypothetical protein